MNSDFFQPAKPLADKVNCLTLTKQFFRNNKVNTSKKELLRSFISYKEIPLVFWLVNISHLNFLPNGGWAMSFLASYQIRTLLYVQPEIQILNRL